MKPENKSQVNIQELVKKSITDEFISNLMSFIDKDIYNYIKASAENHNLSIDLKEYFYIGSFKNETNNNHIFKYLFNKLKEYTLCIVLNELVAEYDIRTNNFVDLEVSVAKSLIFSNNGKWYPKEDIEQNLENNNISESTWNTIKDKIIKLNKWFSNDSNTFSSIKTLSTPSKNLFDHIYKNINSSLSYYFFTLYPSFFFNMKDNKNMLPHHNAILMTLMIMMFYSDDFKVRNVYHTCETVLANMIDGKKIRNESKVQKMYDNCLATFENTLLAITKHEYPLEYTLINFHMQRILKNNFISSISNPIIDRLLINVDLKEVSNFLNDWFSDGRKLSKLTANFEGNKKIPFEIIDSTYNLQLLELISQFNIDLSVTNANDILALNFIETSYTKSDGTVQRLNEINTDDLIVRQNIRIDDFYYFLYDLLSEYKDYLYYNKKYIISEIYNYIPGKFKLESDELTFKDIFKSFRMDSLKTVLINNLSIIKNCEINENETITKADIDNINSIIDTLFYQFLIGINNEIVKIPTFKQNLDFQVNEGSSLFFHIKDNIETISYLILLSANQF